MGIRIERPFAIQNYKYWQKIYLLSTSKSGGRGCHLHYISRDRFRVNMMVLIDVSCKKWSKVHICYDHGF